jgi:iron complex outermembrane receptor protein
MLVHTLLTTCRSRATMQSGNLARSVYGAVAALLLALGPPEALPQSPQIDQGTSSAVDQGVKAPTLEEITVTATRRQESIQNVPISITAYDQKAIEELGIHDIQDIVSLTPGLEVTHGNANNPILSFHGIVSQFTGTSTTGVYIDDTPIQVRNLGQGAAASTAFPSVFDLERIEVLRGPQGTLFGSGSEGGNVRFISAEPSLTDYSGHARAEASTDWNGAPSYQLGLAGGGPIVPDELGFRASVYTQEDGGWINREPYLDAGTSVPNSNANSHDNFALNAALSWRVIDNLTITPSVFYQYSHRGDEDSYWGSRPAAGPPFFTGPVANLSNPNNGSFVSGMLLAQPGTDKFVLPALKTVWKFDNVTLFSNTSYMDRGYNATEDYSVRFGLPPPIPYPTYLNNPQSQFTQELRAQSSDTDARLDWVVGAFYQSVDQKADEYIYDPTLSIPGLLPGRLAYTGFDTSNDKDTAGFGQVDFKITKEFSATAGVRYTHTEFSHTNAQDGPVNGGAFSGIVGSGSENDTTPKYGLNYKLLDNLLFYASASKGFRPGGENNPVSATTCAADLAKLGLTQAPSSYKSDYVWNYEVGSKGSLFDQRLVWDVSVYDVKWSQIQSDVVLNTCLFKFTGNEGSASSRGFDLDVRLNPVHGLTLETSLGYTDAHYDDTVFTGGAQPVVSSGELLPTPPWHLTVTADYTFAALGRQGYLHLDDTYSSSYTLGDPRDALYPLQYSPGSESVNITTVRAGMRNNGWDVSIFVRNLFNNHSIYDSWAFPPVYVDWATPPRVMGVTSTYRF